MLRRQPAQALLLLFVLVAVPLSSCVVVWPWKAKPRPDISTAAKCRVASRHHVYKGESIYPALQEFFKIDGPVVQLPRNVTHITTAATIIQIAVPQLKLVLDPLLYLKAAPKPKGFPKIIHMTLRNKHILAPHQILSIISWGYYHKGYALLLYDNHDITAYMKQFYPGFIPTYVHLKTAVEKSDAWRYHVLCGHGGVYADTDTICAKPFESWLQWNATPAPGLIVGIENLFHSQADAEEASYVHKIQITQWTMAAKKSHPVVCRMGSAIKAFVDHEAATGNSIEQEHGHDASILLRTGPGIWSKEVHKYLRQVGSTPEAVTAGGQVEDLVVLPQAAFGCNFRYWNRDNNASFVYHMFNNSWKVDHYKVADAKKQNRRAREKAEAQKQQAVMYSIAVLAPVCVGLMLARYWGCCSMLLSRFRMRPVLTKRRPHSLSVMTNSPRNSPTTLSPKRSPAPRVSSPNSRVSSSSGSSLLNGRSIQRQSLQVVTGPRKPARLHQ